MFTTIKPLIRGTVAVLQALLTTPGEHYSAAAQKVEDLFHQGFNIRVPAEEQKNYFHDKVSTKISLSGIVM